MKTVEFTYLLAKGIKSNNNNILLKYTCFFLLLFIVVLLFSKKHNKETINQLEYIIVEHKNKYDSLHWEFTVLSNEHDRFGYSLEHIKHKYPNVVKEFYHYYEKETE